jgi:hypothetical protein
MTEQDYAEIVTACDRLLRAPGTSLARVAIPLLHVANEHPSTLNTFRQVFRSDTAADPADLGGTSELPSGQGSPMRMAARAVRAVWRSAVLESGAGKIWQHAAGKAVLGKAADKPGIDVLLLSRLLTSRQLESEDDFYFGALQRELAERGASSILLFVDHRAATDVGLASWIDPIRGVLPRMVAPSTEARIWAQCARARSVLTILTWRASDDKHVRCPTSASRKPTCNARRHREQSPPAFLRRGSVSCPSSAHRYHASRGQCLRTHDLECRAHGRNATAMRRIPAHAASAANSRYPAAGQRLGYRL